MIKRSITFMTLALALTTRVPGAEQKGYQPAFMGLLP